jgi:predicted enzyme related to lactoylglutathione lyase
MYKEYHLKPIALLVYVDNVEAGLNWYKKAFPESKTVYIEEFNFTALKINDFFLEIVQADEKVSSGKFGTVMYWSVSELNIVINNLENLGAALYRGPIAIENGLGMCQFEDPFGNLIGFRGAYTSNT